MDCENCDWSNNRSSIVWKYPCGSQNDCPKKKYNKNYITEYQPLYYLGLGYGFKTYCFKIYEKDGERWVHTNCGTHRRESDVLANTKDLFISKEEINKRLAKSWMAKML